MKTFITMYDMTNPPITWNWEDDVRVLNEKEREIAEHNKELQTK